MNTARHMLIVLALAVAALLLPLNAPVTHAAPPEVTASENPVVIPDGQTTKVITLTWSLALFPPGLATLTVTESGTPAPVLDQIVSQPPGTGTVPLTVTYGKTYTAQLKDAFKQPLGAPLTITTNRPPERADPLGCKLDCVTSIHAPEVHPNSAVFTITTSTPAFIKIELSPMKPDSFDIAGPVVAAAGTLGPITTWTTTLTGLAPSTRYNVVVRAKDTWGNEHVSGKPEGGNGSGHINTPSA